MTEKTTADEVMDWFRRVGTKLSNDEYELGVDLLGKLETQNNRLARHIIRSNEEFEQTLRTEVKKAKAAAWDEGFFDGRRQDAEGDDGPRFVNPYKEQS